MIGHSMRSALGVFGSVGLYILDTTRHSTPRQEFIFMRPEIARTVADIEQAIALLRRHL